MSAGQVDSPLKGAANATRGAVSASDARGLALGFGVAAGMRTATGPAMLSRAARHGHIATAESGIFSLPAKRSLFIALALCAAGEDIIDKTPNIPSRLGFPVIVLRLVAGTGCGIAACRGADKSALSGGLLGALGAFVGAFCGNRLRAYAVRSTGAPDAIFALVEDAGAVAVGLAVPRRPSSGLVIAAAAASLSLALRQPPDANHS